MNKIKLNKYQSILFFILAIIISALCFLPCLTVKNTSYALIESTGGYTGVMEDLQKDESFDVKNYPVIENDYSLQVITIAESAENELFVYTYIPSANENVIATSINISAEARKLSYKNYSLKLIDKDSVFGKYKVNNLIISQSAIREYDISSIFRAWNKEFDKTLSNGNTVSEVAYNVAKLYRFSDTSVNCYETETIEITDKFVGFCRYMDGYNLWPTHCDAHFVAFNTDKPIDKLYEADVCYVEQKYKYFDYGSTSTKNHYSFEEKSDEIYVYLTNEGEGSYSGTGLFQRTYSWKEIESVENFIENENTNFVYNCGDFSVSIGTSLTESGLSNLQKMKWVLRFANTDWYKTIHKTYSTQTGTLICDVTILRLKFETDGNMYNLGVVDNKQTGSLTPSNETVIKTKIPAWFVIAIIIIILIIICILFPQVLPVLIKTIIWIITAPFKLIKIILNNKEK